jgi:lipoprotein NlpI
MTIHSFPSFVAALGILAALAAPAAEVPADKLLNDAQAAALKSDYSNAIALATQAIVQAPTNAQGYYVRGRLHSQMHDSANARADFTQVLRLEPRAGEVYQLRGFENFRLGDFTNAVADFDMFLSFMPKSAPHHWQRGIALYYAGRYDEGRRQFELHRTVNPNDVENAAWHYLCVARDSNLDRARSGLIPIVDDPRVPMMQIHALYAGKAKPVDVIRAAEAGNPSKMDRKHRLFYAYFYIGLWHEAAKETSLAREYIIKAADEFAEPDYMGDVARVHAGLLRKPAEAKP